DTQIKTQQELDALRTEIKKTVDRYRDDKLISRREVRDLSQTVQSVARKADATPEISDSIAENVPSMISARTDIVDLNNTPEGIARCEGIQKTFKEVTSHLNSEEKSILGEVQIETVDDLRNLSVEQLIKLEDLHEGILLYAFTDFVGGDKKIDLTDFESFYKNPTSGQKLLVDFRNNTDAENRLGAADILPPSIRKITVYPEGDESVHRMRTSTSRIGLKGKNKEGNGFIDGGGYIPVYSTDVIMIGGVDKNFENQYRKKGPDGALLYGKDALDYAAYNAKFGAKEAADISTLRKAGKSVSKQYTPEEIEALEAQINASGVRKNIVSAALRNLGKVATKMSCWDWANSVYREAGVTYRDVYHHSNYPIKIIGKDKNGKPICQYNNSPENPPKRLLNSIDAGDWIYFHNKNGSDYVGDHSAIFLRWIDKENLIGEVVSNPAGGNPVRKHSVDFKKKPVTFIQKPVPLRKGKS
ncbi:MAG: hypothetical protein WCW30_04460, partial [Candidatus Gracilibacteria bacterium]